MIRAMAPTTQPRPQTKQERVFDELRARIASGRYPPGHRVVIASIAEELGVSALPVREAIRRLEAAGLVVFEPNTGARVTPADAEGFEQNMTTLAVLEGYATALAAPRLRPEDFAQLEQITDDMVAAMERMDILVFGRLNHGFHGVIYERCPNPALVRMAREINSRLASIRETIFVQIPYRGSESVREHRALIALLREGAPADQLEAAAREHKLRTVESFQRWRHERESNPPMHQT
jgi:DNA-binding GntR family transcriptional regulator